MRYTTRHIFRGLGLEGALNINYLNIARESLGRSFIEQLKPLISEEKTDYYLNEKYIELSLYVFQVNDFRDKMYKIKDKLSDKDFKVVRDILLGCK